MNEEFNRYLADSAKVRAIPGDAPDKPKVETALQFWCRQSEHYKLLSNVARIVYGFPVSSAQMERDFGVSGMMLTPQRSTISPENLDMCSFLSRNQEWVDIIQCEKIHPSETEQFTPQNLRIDLLADETTADETRPAEAATVVDDVTGFLADFFSGTMISEE